MKNYMANKSFSRGVETLGAEASMVFVGNTQHNVPYMLKHSDLFDELPAKYHDSAFLDRLHFYIPGWEVDIIRGEMFSDGYGFVVDYLAEILRSLRNHDYSDRYRDFFSLSSDISTRDRDGIQKTFSGMMKILFPDGKASEEEMEDILKFAIEGRKRVKDQLMRIDTTYSNVVFSYSNQAGKSFAVKTLEESEYPQYYSQTVADEPDAEEEPSTRGPEEQEETAPKAGHFTYNENQRGVSFQKLFAAHLKGASEITITDPYIRLFYQARNLMELLEVIIANKAEEDEVQVHLVTVEDDFKGPQQKEYFEKMQESCATAGVQFSWEFNPDNTIHARHITTDHGWKILLDRGLDIFQAYEMNDAFSLSNRQQQHRSCKAFEITYLKEQ
jgi:ATP-dependent Lon protease